MISDLKILKNFIRSTFQHVTKDQAQDYLLVLAIKRALKSGEIGILRSGSCFTTVFCNLEIIGVLFIEY